VLHHGRRRCVIRDVSDRLDVSDDLEARQRQSSDPEITGIVTPKLVDIQIGIEQSMAHYEQHLHPPLAICLPIYDRRSRRRMYVWIGRRGQVSSFFMDEGMDPLAPAERVFVFWGLGE
jgi:hypothetical protein